MPLSDEEFNDLLHKRLAASNEEVPDGCEAVAEAMSETMTGEDETDLALLREALGSYKAETLAWAEERSATMPSPRPSAVAALWDRAPRWALAGIGAVACAVAAVSAGHISSAPASIAIIAPNAQVLAADNRLLTSVDDALAGNGSILTEQDLGLSPADFSTPAQDTQKHGRTQNSIN